MTTKVEKSIVVGVPVRTAYNQWTQFEEFPLFMSAVDEVRQLSDDRLLWVARIAGVRREWEARILEQVPDQKVAWAATEGATNAGTVTFADAGQGTQVTVLLEFEPEGFIEAVGDALGIVRREVEVSLERFKEFIEARGRETGEWRGSIHEGSGRPTLADAASSRGDSGKVGDDTAGRGGSRYDLEDPDRDAPRSTVDRSAPTGPAPVADPAGTYVAGTAAGVGAARVGDPALDRVESGLPSTGETVPEGGLSEQEAWPAEHRAQSGLSSPGETVPEGGLTPEDAYIVEHKAETGLSSPGATVPGGGLTPEDEWVVEHKVESGLSSPGPTVEPEPTRDDDRVAIDPEGNTRDTGDPHSPQHGPEVDDPNNPKGHGTGRPLI